MVRTKQIAGRSRSSHSSNVVAAVMQSRSKQAVRRKNKKAKDATVVPEIMEEEHSDDSEDLAGGEEDGQLGEESQSDEDEHSESDEEEEHVIVRKPVRRSSRKGKEVQQSSDSDDEGSKSDADTDDGDDEESDAEEEGEEEEGNGDGEEEAADELGDAEKLKRYMRRKMMREPKRGKKNKKPDRSKLFFNGRAEKRYVLSLRRKLTNTKVLKPRTKIGKSLTYILDYFRPSHLDKLITLNSPVYPDAVRQFYANLELHEHEPNLTMVYGKPIPVTPYTINEALGCPWINATTLVGDTNDVPYDAYYDYTWPDVADNQPIDPIELGVEFFRIEPIEGKGAGPAVQYRVENLSPEHRLVFEWICFNVLPTDGHACEPTIATCMLFYYLVRGLKVNPGQLIDMYMRKCGNHKSKHFPYGSLITKMMEKQGIDPKGPPTLNDYYDKDWINSVRLELDIETGKYKKKEVAPGVAARVAKRKIDAENRGSTSVEERAKLKKMMGKLTKMWACFDDHLEKQEQELGELVAQQDAIINEFQLQVCESDNEKEPDYAPIPTSSDEDMQLGGGEAGLNADGSAEIGQGSYVSQSNPSVYQAEGTAAATQVHGTAEIVQATSEIQSNPSSNVAANQVQGSAENFVANEHGSAVDEPGS